MRKERKKGDKGEKERKKGKDCLNYSVCAC